MVSQVDEKSRDVLFWKTWTFSTGLVSRMVPVLRTLRLLTPLLLMIARTSVLPICSSLTSRALARFLLAGAAMAMEARATKDRNFMMGEVGGEDVRGFDGQG